MIKTDQHAHCVPDVVAFGEVGSDVAAASFVAGTGRSENGSGDERERCILDRAAAFDARLTLWRGTGQRVGGRREADLVSPDPGALAHHRLHNGPVSDDDRGWRYSRGAPRAT